MQKIDTTTYVSKASAEYAAKVDSLTAQRDEFEARCREAVSTMSRAETLKALAEVNQTLAERTKASDPKAKVVEVLVAAHVKRHEAASELDRLSQAAHADKRMAMRINQMMERAEGALAKVVEHSGGTTDPFTVADSMSWRGDDFMTATATARIAQRVASAVNNGHDIREVALSIVKDALRDILSLPATLLNNGVGGMHRSDSLYNAAGARNYIAAVGELYGFASGLEDIAITDMINVGHLA